MNVPKLYTKIDLGCYITFEYAILVAKIKNLTIMKKLSFVLFYMLVLSSCSFHIKETGDKTIKVFSKVQVNFKDTIIEKENFLRLGNGRLLLQKVILPEYKRKVDIIARLKLISNGDPWDKSGSCFLIPAESAINIMNIATGENNYPANVYNYAGIIPGNNFKPLMEIMRFMTPFGVGHFSDTARITPPVYVPEWEKEVVWEQNISEMADRLNGEVWIGIWIDTWTDKGYIADLELQYTENKEACSKQIRSKTEPLVNTVYYNGPQEIPGFFADTSLYVDFEIPENAKNVQLKYTVTGHGGHHGGDEFTKRENIISVNEKEVLRFTPWRNDCASFRRFNPSSGVWKVPHKFRGKEMEQLLASSDLSRSNWCPGSNVEPFTIPLNEIASGKHQLKISIPKAQAMDGDKYNHWLISCYIYMEF